MAAPPHLRHLVMPRVEYLALDRLVLRWAALDHPQELALVSSSSKQHHNLEDRGLRVYRMGEDFQWGLRVALLVQNVVLSESRNGRPRKT